MIDDIVVKENCISARRERTAEDKTSYSLSIVQCKRVASSNSHVINGIRNGRLPSEKWTWTTDETRQVNWNESAYSVQHWQHSWGDQQAAVPRWPVRYEDHQSNIRQTIIAMLPAGLWTVPYTKPNISCCYSAFELYTDSIYHLTWHSGWVTIFVVDESSATNIVTQPAWRAYSVDGNHTAILQCMSTK